MVLTPDIEQLLTGWWAVHPGGMNLIAEERFARWPKQHIVFDGPAWRRYESGRLWRLNHAGVSAGFWRSVEVDGRPLLVLTVQSYRPSRRECATARPKCTSCRCTSSPTGSP